MICFLPLSCYSLSFTLPKTGIIIGFPLFATLAISHFQISTELTSFSWRKGNGGNRTNAEGESAKRNPMDIVFLELLTTLYLYFSPHFLERKSNMENIRGKKE